MTDTGRRWFTGSWLPGTGISLILQVSNLESVLFEYRLLTCQQEYLIYHRMQCPILSILDCMYYTACMKKIEYLSNCSNIFFSLHIYVDLMNIEFVTVSL